MNQGDYSKWLQGFKDRNASQYKYDQGHIDMSECTEEWFNALIKKYQQMAADDKIYIFDIFRRTDQAHIGTIDFSTIMRDSFQWAMVGYTIHNQYFKKGYGKEAVKAGLNIGFQKLKYHRIEAHINLDNTPSIKLAENVGMEFECIRKNFIDENDEWTDNLVYYINA